MKRTEIVPADVERPVVVQQACAAALGELSAETQIIAEALLWGDSARLTFEYSTDQRRPLVPHTAIGQRGRLYSSATARKL